MNDEKTGLPANIKQIGSISGEGRIYVEDYASTYLKQYSESEPSKEKVAVLVGERRLIDSEEVLLVSGVIKGKYTVRRGSFTEPTEKTWQYVDKQMKLYFQGLEVIGWAYVQPGFEDYLSEGILNYQRQNADRGLKLLYLCDPNEKLATFFRWDTASNAFVTVRGYLVYYEKNEGMHEYMLENKIKCIVRADTASQKAETTDEKLARTLRSEHKPKSKTEQKRLSDLVGSVSFVMLSVAIIMGAGIVRSDKRIKTVESKIALLESDLTDVQAVFAAQKQTEAATEQTTVAVTETTVAATAAEVNDSYNYYTVEQGDTVLKICQKHYGNTDKVSEVLELNDINDPSRLYVGMELKLPEE